MIDLTNPRHAANRGPVSTTADAERRRRAAIMAAKLPSVPAGSLPGLSPSVNFRSEEERRRDCAPATHVGRAKGNDAGQIPSELLDSLPPPLRDWIERFPLPFTVPGVKTMKWIYEKQKASGGAAQFSAFDLAKQFTGWSADDARSALDALVNAGAVKKTEGFGPGVKSTYRIPV